ncbi:hypothetical protein B0T22DRAFT_406554 [Podospora appendiculata]|uniref:RGS domain-containing protein n=1 Tax=Podospora appendiculata TaxID=314037 RepID=A0AAE1CC99_9PEZI|nr:hypothetical protein B0T22DRAFT_406554 [Podospora appendiculata]
MLSMKRGTFGSPPTLGEDWNRRNSLQANPVLVLPYRIDPRTGDMKSAAPPSPATSGSSRSRAEKLHLPLRSDSGLALHANQSAFRQFTDYNSDGSLRSPGYRMRPLSYDGISSIDTISLGNRRSEESREPPQPSQSIPDFFDRNVINMAFDNPTTGQKIYQFARGRHCAGDVEFLLKLDEYSRAFGSMTSLISQISTTFTGVAATTPLDLPPDTAKLLRSNTKHCARSSLPPLERLYRDAKISVEDRLAKTLYPEFVKYQLAQCMRSSLSVSRSLTGGFKSAYPGLGNSFCLTDPLEPDNPIVFASDGFVKLSGYQRHEVMRKNCRLMQGISTDVEVSRRLREAVAIGRETVELIVNHRKDGSPFWNLLFVCPLQEHGSVRYCLGGQINVSDNMGTEFKDILRILNFGLPGEEIPSGSGLNSQERPVRRSPVSQEELPDRAPSPRPQKGSSNRHRFFRRFSRRSAKPKTTSSRPNTPAKSGVTEDAPSAKRLAYTTRTPPVEQRLDEFSTPYARFFVMQYVPATSQSPQADRRSSMPRMPIAFCSSYALELLGLKSNDGDRALNRDIFTVLAENSSSPCIGRGVRNTVMDKIAAGEVVSVDLLASAEPAARHMPKQSRNGSLIRSNAALSGETETKPRLSDTFDRGAEILSHVFFGPKMRKLVSHWTPLKDADGAVGWVVLILTPATS